MFYPIYDFDEKLLEKLDWQELSDNPNAIPILEKHLDKVYWKWFSGNPNAVSILENNLDKVDWFWLSENPNAIPPHFWGGEKFRQSELALFVKKSKCYFNT